MESSALNCLQHIGQSIWNTVSTDGFANLVDFAGLVIALLGLFVGGKKVMNLIDEYRVKRRNALFGFYTNLMLFNKRLRALITTSEKKTTDVIYLMSPEEDLRNRYSEETGLSPKLHNLSSEYLQYLSTESNQVPPANKSTDWEEWNNNIMALVDYLNKFYTIGSDIYYPELNSEQGIEKFHNKLTELLDEIDKKIKNEQKFFSTR